MQGGSGGGGGYQGGYLPFQQQQQYHGVGVGGVGTGSGSGWAPSCSLAKLQQMADAPQHHPPPHTPPAQTTQVRGARSHDRSIAIILIATE